MNPDDVPTATRTMIELRYGAHLVRQLAAQLGRDVVLGALRVSNDARTKRAAARAGAASMPDLEQLGRAFAAFSGEDELLEHRATTDGDDVVVEVTSCQYAATFAELGDPELGSILSCGQDPAIAAATGLDLERDETLMLGGDVCRFRFRPGGTVAGSHFTPVELR